MGKIDRPIDAVLSQYPEEPSNQVGEFGIEIAGILSPLVKIVNIFRQRTAADGRNERTRALFSAINEELLRLEGLIEGGKQSAASLEDRLESPEFADALMLATEEAQRTTNELKVSRLAAVLVNAAALKVDSAPGEDLSSFIREVGHLDEGDVQMLQLMGEAYADAIRARPDMSDPEEFTLRVQGFLRLVDARQISRDDAWSRCTRLSGFGLAIEVPRNQFRMSPSDHCFRPSQRGLRFLKLLIGR